MKLWAHQKYAVEKYKDRPFFGLLFPCGTGKGQPVTSKVLTKKGFVTLGSLKIGDRVISPVDGKEYPVTGIFNKGKRHVNKVMFSNRTATYCDDDHLWNIQTSSQRSENKEEFHTVNMEQLKEIPLKKATKRGDRIDHYHNVYIPVNAPVEFTEEDYTEIAYVIGMFIGDGCYKGCSITLAEEDVKERFRKDIERMGYFLQHKGSYDYRININIGANSLYTDSFTKFLISWKLTGHSYEKRIPEKLLYASIGTRKRLLEGLIDSDGSNGGGGKIDYVSTSEGLIEDITFLVSSLGGVVTRLKAKQGSYKQGNKRQPCRTAYRCSFRLPCELNLSAKHTAELNKKFQRGQYKCIECIKDAGEQECVCIYIDSPDHLYITDDWIVTHNTLTAIAIAEAKEKPTLIIAPNALCQQWKEEIEDKGEKDWEVLVCTSKSRKTKKFKETFNKLIGR